jgi:hypothetical protein
MLSSHTEIEWGPDAVYIPIAIGTYAGSMTSPQKLNSSSAAGNKKLKSNDSNIGYNSKSIV